MHNVGTLIARAVLIDVAGLKGVDILPDNYEITVADLEAAVKKQNITFQQGDAIIIHTGWGKLWGKENARYYKTCPGLGVPAAQWLIAKDPLLLGADNFPVEVAPNPDRSLNLPVHQLALVVHGVHLLENLKLDELVAQERQRVRAGRTAVEDAGRHRIDGRAGGAAVSGVQPSALRGAIIVLVVIGLAYALARILFGLP